jgi:hypothetical protein
MKIVSFERIVPHRSRPDNTSSILTNPRKLLIPAPLFQSVIPIGLPTIWAMADKDKTYRDHVIQEIYETEKSFNAGLQLTLDKVTTPMHAAIARKAISFENPEIPRLFDALDQVRLVSLTLSDELGHYFETPPQSLTTCLQNFPCLIVMYFDYIRSYHSVAPQLRIALDTNRQLRTFFDARELDLGAQVQTYLITPIQRPPRYRMLFADLLKHTDPASPEYAPLQEAVEMINDKVAKLDSGIEEFEEACAMAELHSRLLSFPVFVAQRRLFFQGDAIKFSRKKQQPRYLVLFSDVLVLAEPGLIGTTQLKPNKVYQQRQYLIRDVADCAPFVNAIDIRQKQKSFRLNLKSPADKRDALDGFKKMMKYVDVSLTDLEALGLAPVWIPDDLAPACMECGSKFSFVHRRHHCRACGNCICKDCFEHEIAIPGLGPDPQGVCSSCFDHITLLIVEQAAQVVRDQRQAMTWARADTVMPGVKIQTRPRRSSG